MASFIVFAVANICCRKVWLCPYGIVKLVMLQQGCTEVWQHYPSKSLRMCAPLAGLADPTFSSWSNQVSIRAAVSRGTFSRTSGACS